MRQRTINMTSQPQAAPRRRATAVAGERPPAPERLSDERFEAEDLLEAPPVGLMDAEFQWDDVDFPDEAAEEAGSEASALPERSVPEHDRVDAEADEQATEADNLVLRYLQEAGRVPLLTPAGEVDLAQRIEAAKARVVAVLQGHIPSSPHGPVWEGALHEASDAWVADRLRQVQNWVARLERGDEVEVQRDSGLSPERLRQMWATLEQEQRTFEGVGRQRLEVVRVVEVRRAVEGPAGSLNTAKMGQLFQVGRALEHQMLEKMGKSGTPLGFGPDPDVVDDRDADHRRAAVRG